MPSYSRMQLENWLKTIDVYAQRVLDVGGSQLPINKRVNAFFVEEYKVLDLEKPHEMVKPVDYVMDINRKIPRELKDQLWNQFEIVFCIEVMEYIHNPYQAIQNINRFLKRGGILYISFHFVYPMHNPAHEDCLRYTRFGCMRLLEKNGFEIIHLVPRLTEAGSINALYLTEQMKAAKNINHEETGYLIKAKKK